jgi:hypothetical protein
MAVTGEFRADFSSFNDAVQGAQARLVGFEGSAKQVESSLRLMTQSQEQMLDKIGAAGGRIQDVGAAAGGATSLVGGLSASYKGMDSAMQAVGLHIGPQVKGLLEIGTAATAGAASLGVLGTAGAVFASAMAGWKIGRMISDFLGLDAAIQGAAESLGLIGSVAGETAAAKQDTINLAIAKGAAETINYANAIKFLAEQGQIATDKQINWRDRLADSYRELRNLTDAQKIEIGIAQEAGATTEQLTNKYGIHANTLKLLQIETDKTTAAQKKLNEERQKDLDAAEKRRVANEAGIAQMDIDKRLMDDRAKFDAEQEALRIKRLETGAAYVKQMGEIAAVNKAAVDFDKNLVTEQAALEQSNQELIASFGGMEEAHTEAGAAAEAGTAATVAGYQAVAQQVEITSDGVKGWLELMRATNAANALLSQNSLFTTGSTLENQSRLGTAFSPIPGFASGVENFEGGLAKVHGGEVLANLPRGTSVFPRGQVGGATVSNVFNLVDSESNLAKRVAEMIMRQIRAGTQLGTA